MATRVKLQPEKQSSHHYQKKIV
uniref:Uncharacterized protein n=1 Tax=Rhizophora mucronata TaxID=61149 RepID=A0A2P2NKG2_RHIMU